MRPLRYGLFAIPAILVNLVFQWMSFQVYSGNSSLYIAMAIGTLAGLVCKYTLDKHYVFDCETKKVKEEAVQFFTYSFFGVFTTVIFWGSEIAFFYCWQVPRAKYVGGFLGLVLGYTVKYFWDKQFVFFERGAHAEKCNAEES